MPKSSKYTSKQPDAKGRIHYTDEEHSVWRELITTQIPMLPGRACDTYIRALDTMDFPHDRIP